MLKHSVKLRRYIHILDDVTACRRAACVLCGVQSETETQSHSALHTTHMPLVSLCTAHKTHAASLTLHCTQHTCR